MWGIAPQTSSSCCETHARTWGHLQPIKVRKVASGRTSGSAGLRLSIKDRPPSSCLFFTWFTSPAAAWTCRGASSSASVGLWRVRAERVSGRTRTLPRHPPTHHQHPGLGSHELSLSWSLCGSVCCHRSGEVRTHLRKELRDFDLARLVRPSERASERASGGAPEPFPASCLLPARLPQPVWK